MQIRVHELAKELKISTKALREHLTDMNVIVKSHMSLVEAEVADEIRNKYNEQMAAEKKAEKDRRRLVEMRQAAKAEKTEVKAAPKKQSAVEEPEAPKEKKAAKPARDRKKTAKPEPVEEPVLDEADQEEQELETPEPAQPEIYIPPEKEAPKHKIIVPFTQATPVQPRGKRITKAKTDEAPADKPAISRRRGGAARPAAVPAPPPPEIPIQAADAKKYGKAKPKIDDLGDKSKHKIQTQRRALA